MRSIAIGLIGLSALSFLLAVVAVLTEIPIPVSAEGLSRACSNLALIAIALGLWFGVEAD